MDVSWRWTETSVKVHKARLDVGEVHGREKAERSGKEGGQARRRGGGFLC